MANDGSEVEVRLGQVFHNRFIGINKILSPEETKKVGEIILPCSMHGPWANIATSDTGMPYTVLRYTASNIAAESRFRALADTVAEVLTSEDSQAVISQAGGPIAWRGPNELFDGQPLPYVPTHYRQSLGKLASDLVTPNRYSPPAGQ